MTGLFLSIKFEHMLSGYVRVFLPTVGLGHVPQSELIGSGELLVADRAYPAPATRHEPVLSLSLFYDGALWYQHYDILYNDDCQMDGATGSDQSKNGLLGNA